MTKMLFQFLAHPKIPHAHAQVAPAHQLRHFLAGASLQMQQRHQHPFHRLQPRQQLLHNLPRRECVRRIQFTFRRRQSFYHNLSSSPRSAQRNSGRTRSALIWLMQVLIAMRDTQCSSGTAPLN